MVNRWTFFSILVVAAFVVALTALDKYDERTCSQTRTREWQKPGSSDPVVYGWRTDCDGFLPW